MEPREYAVDELALIGKVPPDGWSVYTISEGCKETGDIMDLEDALLTFAEAIVSTNPVYESVELVPLWNPAWHEMDNSE